MFEAIAIRLLWAMNAFIPNKRPGLCPPQCHKGHTYKFPCRARTRNSVYSRYMARPKVRDTDEATSFAQFMSDRY